MTTFTDARRGLPPRTVVGDVLLHPLSVVCLVLWALNDHVWKAQYGNWLTGKLSDVCSMVVFPLLVFTVLQWGLRRGRVPRAPRTGELGMVLGVVCACFIAMESTVWGDFAYRFLVALTRDPLATLVAPHGMARRIHHVADTADLLALPMLGVAWMVARRHCYSGRSSASGCSGSSGA